MYSLYNESLDYYFVAITSAMTPTFLGTVLDGGTGNLFGVTYFPSTDGQTELVYNVNFIDRPIVALNGLVLAYNFDYSISSYTITFSGALKTTDVVTLIGNIGSLAYPIHNDLITIDNPIASGATDGEGSNSVYYNTTTGKYEVYTTITPLVNSQIIITLNGAVLAPNIDYYKSITNPKRFILEGNLLINDVINLFYYPLTNVVDNLFSNTLNVNWEIAIAPQLANGEFTLEVSDDGFSTLIASATTPYVANVLAYYTSLQLSGSAGTTLYYRVRNVKNYLTLVGDIITTEAYSEEIPIYIAVNSINSY
jgi:hypothetical protein